MMKPQIITTFSQSVDLKLWQMWKSDAVHYNRTEAVLVCSFSWQKLWIAEWEDKGSIPWETSCPMSRENKWGSSQETIPSCAWLNKILATFLAHSVDKSFGLQSGRIRVQSLERLVVQCTGKTNEGHHKRLYLHVRGSIKSWPHSTGGSPFSSSEEVITLSAFMVIYIVLTWLK